MDDPHVNPYNAGPAEIPSLLTPGSVMASPTVVEFDLTIDDLAAYGWNKFMASPGMKRQLFGLRMLFVFLLILIAATIPVLYVLDAVEYGAPADPLVFLWHVWPLIALLAPVILACVFVVPWYRKAIRNNMRRLYSDQAERRSICHRRLEMSANGLAQKGESFESHLAWAAIDRIAEDERHIFFDAGLAGEMIVPRKAFLHDAVFRAFVATARHYHQQAAQTPAVA